MIVKKMCLILSVLFVVSFSVSAWADVTIYAEGAYTENDLAVYIYADISGDAILSAGVKLIYPSGELALTSATKNEEIWYMGDGSSNEAYMDPDTSVAGEVVLICGKLDSNEGHALDGVSGDRVLLGVVRFDRTYTTTPFVPALALDYGKADPYKNFVETDGDVLDGSVTFAIEVHERGDANGDDNITNADQSSVQFFLTNGGVAHPWMDCNDDDHDVEIKITNADRSCIIYKLTH